MKTFKKIFKPLTLKEIGKKVTSQIIECLKNGTIPWKSGLLGQASSMVNCNGVAYRGVNQWLTISKAILEGYKSNRWITFNQCRKEGGSIVKGSKGLSLVKWLFKYRPDKDCSACGGDAKEKLDCPVECGRTIPIPKTFTVFNMEQTTIFDAKVHVPDAPKVEDVEVNVGMAHQLVSDWNNVVPIKYGFSNNSSPYYAPSSDFINIPFGDSVSWVNEEILHKVTFHEAMHSTGHKSRLNRFDKATLDGVGAGQLHSQGQYSAEELVAEMGSQILADFCNFKLDHIENTSAYINSWIKVLKNNPEWVIWASSRAVKGADMIIDNSLKIAKKELKAGDTTAGGGLVIGVASHPDFPKAN